MPDQPAHRRLRAIVARSLRRMDVELAVAFLALFVALGGTGYAAIVITGRSIKDGTLTGADVKAASLTRSALNASVQRALDLRPAPGLRGPTGETGPAGAQGATGARGVSGGPGAAGRQGPACDPAVFGAACGGPEGLPGVAGPRGGEGPQGERGEAGGSGWQGIPGERGPDGLKGPVGPRGLQGAHGRNGVNPNGWSTGEQVRAFDPTVYSEEYERVARLFTSPNGGRYLITWTGTISSDTGDHALCELVIYRGSTSPVLARQVVHDVQHGASAMMQAHVDLSTTYASQYGDELWVRCGGGLGVGTPAPRYEARSTLVAIETAN